MKSLVRVFLLAGFGVALLSLSAVSKAHAISPELTLDSEKVQVVHGSGYNNDTTTMTLTLTNHGEPGCDSDDDLISTGLEEIGLSGCSCEDFIYCWFMDCTKPFDDSINTFVSHTIAGHQYGTFYSNTEPGGAGTTTLSAKATKLTTPMGACGSWTLNLTATKLNLKSITTSSAMHPIALFINDGDDSGPFCFDIPDAVVGPVITH
ncbi:MAG TPA: hypothetical protein VEU51_04870 [Candidatus Acidoferrales bacterium]|nr:hypothetical protein [Candidatus Acidoferrales bacterium]